MKKLIDIEKLVQWALRDELPKGRTVSASAWDLITQFGQLGTLIDTTRGGSDGFGFVPGAPHEDAIKVAAAIERVADEARLPDSGEALGLFGDLAPIAEDCAASLLVASFNPRAIVISRAIAGQRPVWEFETPTPYPIHRQERSAAGSLRDVLLVKGLDADGDLVEMKPNRGRAVERDGMYSYAMAPRCPLQWNDPSLMSIGHARAEYVAWHGALVALAASIGDTLAEYMPTPPAARALPWVTGQIVPSRVLHPVTPAPAYLPDDFLLISPKRRAPGRPTPHARHGKAISLNELCPAYSQEMAATIGQVA
jgi:hypothetical protein